MATAEPAGIILVRHAMPEVEPGKPSTLWRLGEHAREDCVLLAHGLPEGLARTVFASDQPKAAETGTIIALRRRLRTTKDPRFGEVAQDGRWIDDYREVAATYLDGAAVRGWKRGGPW